MNPIPYAPSVPTLSHIPHCLSNLKTRQLRTFSPYDPPRLALRPSLGNTYSQPKMTVPNIKLNSGNDMPQVGFGLWKVEGPGAADTVYNAIKAGYRLFDGACGKLPARFLPFPPCPNCLRALLRFRPRQLCNLSRVPGCQSAVGRISPGLKILGEAKSL